MKTIIRATLLFAMLFIANISVNAQNNLIRNTEEKDGVIVSETVFKMEGGALNNYMKYNYKYDENKQKIEAETMKWDGLSEEWVKDLCIRYVYTDTTITTEYYKWDKKKKDYVIIPKMTVTLNR